MLNEMSKQKLLFTDEQICVNNHVRYVCVNNLYQFVLRYVPELTVYLIFNFSLASDALE